MCTMMVLFILLYLRYTEILLINFGKELKFSMLCVHQNCTHDGI